MFSNKKKIYALVNFTIILLVIIWNYWANTSTVNEYTVGELSDKYNSLFTPAGYAFSIWGLIFLGLLVHGIYQLNCAFTYSKPDEFIEKIGPWLSIANIGNGLWIWVWLQERTGLSVVVMTIILVSLIVVILKLNMERWNAPKAVIAFIWWPICLYSGWISVATIANISAHLAHLEWSFLFSPITWTIIMIVFATLLNIIMVKARNMREFACVGVWALIAISVRHWDKLPTLQWTSIICAFILLIIISIHGYQNRKSNPFSKIEN